MRIMDGGDKWQPEAKVEKDPLASAREHLDASKRSLEKGDYHMMRLEMLLAPLLKKYGLR